MTSRCLQLCTRIYIRNPNLTPDLPGLYQMLLRHAKVEGGRRERGNPQKDSCGVPAVRAVKYDDYRKVLQMQLESINEND